MGDSWRQDLALSSVCIRRTTWRLSAILGFIFTLSLAPEKTGRLKVLELGISPPPGWLRSGNYLVLGIGLFKDNAWGVFIPA